MPTQYDPSGHEPASDAEQRLTERSRAVFDDAVARHDGHTRSRLNQARQAALQAVRSPERSPQRWLLPVGSAAVLVLATVVTVQILQRDRQPSPDAAPDAQLARTNTVDDLELMTSDADIDLLRDMDFYAWLDTQDITANSPDSGES